MITNAELARLRSVAQRLLHDEATVLRVVRTADGAGGWLESETAVGTYPALLSVGGMKPSVQRIAERLDVAALWLITLPHDANVQEHDVVAIAGRRFKIVQVEAHTIQVLKVCVGEELT
jgi:hypothetical protein